MRKVLILLSIFFMMMAKTSRSAFSELKRDGKEKANFSLIKTRAAAEILVNLTRKEFEQLSGRHLSLLERLVFKLAQKQAGKKFEEQKQSQGFNPIGFFAPLLSGIVGLPLGALVGFGLLSLLLSVSGIAATYVFSKDRNMHKWAWIGFGAYVVGIIALVIWIITSGDFG